MVKPQSQWNTAVWTGGYYPVPKVTAYDVSNVDGHVKTYRAEDKDILGDYIEIDSLHYEWSCVSGDDWMPGAVIPARLTVTVLPDCPGLQYAVPTPECASLTDLEVTWLLKINWVNATTGAMSDVMEIGPKMICVSKTGGRNGNKYRLVFEGWLRVLDYITVDMAAWTGQSWRTCAANILAQAGFNTATTNLLQRTNIFAGNSYYTGQPMSGRQALSYILQLSGCHIVHRNNNLIICPLKVKYGNSDINVGYTRDWSFGDYDGAISWASAEPAEWAAADSKSWAAKPGWVYLTGNPFITEGNYQAITTQLATTCTGWSIGGFEIEVLMNVYLEPGDHIHVYYGTKAGPDAQVVGTSYDIVVTRIEWDGGAYMKISEVPYDPVNRIHTGAAS